MKTTGLTTLFGTLATANAILSDTTSDTIDNDGTSGHHHHHQKPITPSPPPSDPISTIPPLGLGLWNSKDISATFATLTAFHNNYTHLDGAAAYNNEVYVGKALSNSTAPPRHTYWLTSKLWNTMHKPINVPKAFNQTLADYNTTYLDLYLMHWPVAFLPDAPEGRTIIDQDTSITDTWSAMEALASSYKASNGAYGARHIGISNFSPRQIDTIMRMCTICPYAHEFETHPYLQQQEFVNWHQKHDIKVIAYSPLSNLNPVYKDVMPDLPPILEDSFWKAVAGKKHVSVAQAVLGWGVARGTIVIPKSVHEERIKENIEALKLSFTEKELEEVAKEDKKIRFNNPSKSWGVELFEGLDDGPNRFLVEEGDGEL